MHIYIIGSNDGPYKVGVAASVEKRLRALQTGNPQRLLIHYQIPSRDKFNPFAVEKSVHSRLSEYRMAGEWFSCSISTAKGAMDDAVNELQELPSMQSKVWAQLNARVSKEAMDALDIFATQNNLGVGRAIELLLAKQGLISDNATAPSTAMDADAVYGILNSADGPFPHSVLARKKGIGMLSRRRLRAALDHLIEGGRIERAGGGRRVSYSVAKDIAKRSC